MLGDFFLSISNGKCQKSNLTKFHMSHFLKLCQIRFLTPDSVFPCEILVSSHPSSHSVMLAQNSCKNQLNLATLSFKMLDIFVFCRIPAFRPPTLPSSGLSSVDESVFFNRYRIVLVINF